MTEFEPTITQRELDVIAYRERVETFIEAQEEPVTYRQIREALQDDKGLLALAVVSEKIIRIPGLYDRFIWHTKEAPKRSWLPLESDRYSRKHYRHAHQVFG